MNNVNNNVYSSFARHYNMAESQKRKEERAPKSFGIQFEKKNAPEIASLAFATSLFAVIPNWDKIAKGTLKYKAGFLSAVAAGSLLVATGAMALYKMGKKALQKD
ncbi:hypothetical protein tpqmel_0554 [Candidatus Gastranaerophilus sp. (ex Termes propinquus)]|nr:hypothetical protein tpqmel_0554 [Candidatus Gastranaerophilus sp. (ex Termes propinquus)]